MAFHNLYGGTYTLLTSTLKKFGIETTLIPLTADDEEVRRAFRPNTKLLFGETIGNPGVEVLDIQRAASLAHEAGVPLFVDNTFATPYLCRPIEHGADIVIHSATKYLDGHATSLGGFIVDSGRFNWENGKFPHLTEEDPNYHGLSYTRAFGAKAFAVKARAVFLRDFGTTLSPFNAFLINLGTETLHLRMQRHSENALAIAKALQKNPQVEWVRYPLLPESSTYELTQKYLPLGGSGIISFGIKGNWQVSKEFINKLQLASLVVHVGDLRTHVLHPASMTHRQLSVEAQKKAGILENMIRLSVGIENVTDILKDLEQALHT
ncbi:L-methionine gamma-lyase [bioreactor metagenome]|uniref:L-methionine gamma-lyase n=1 Tax=bioreactor metagenome TaxID=1076179 RepID=A0A644Z9I9_9ZZZZ